MYEWHTMVGRAILEEWGFPEEITLVADEHEVLDREHVERTGPVGHRLGRPIYW